MAEDKQHSTLSSWSRLYKHFGKYRKYMVVALSLAVISAAFTVIGPIWIEGLINTIVDGMKSGKTIDTELVTLLSVALVATFLLSGLFEYLRSLILVKASLNNSKVLRSEMKDKINRVPLSYLDNCSTGDVVSRVTNDLDIVGEQASSCIGTMFTAATVFVGSTLMMFYANWIMALISVIVSLLGMGVMMFIISRTQKHFNEQQKVIGELDGIIQENYSGHSTVKVYNESKNSLNKFGEVNKRLFDANFKSDFFGELTMPIMVFVGNLGYVAVSIGGVILMAYGVDNINIGIIVAFMFYVRLFNNALTEVSQMAMEFQMVAAAAGRVFDFLEVEEMEPETDKTAVLNDVKGSVEFRDVHFGYTPDKEIIHGFSMKVEPGQKVAIVGSTGAGKTTIVNLLMRFYDVSSGDILIDGISINSVRRENVHDQFCMVLQDSWIFEGTIKENIRFSKEDVTDEEIIDACKAVGINHFVESLPDKYDTVLSDKISISAGQKQQITIARAIVQKAPMLILDEATSMIDTRTEKIIQEVMDKLTEGKTSFVIAHRLSTVRNSDLIMVMKDGNIIEHGKHEELLSKKGFYHELYYSQFVQS